jgi:uncharacterized cofD-like protein
MDPVKKSNQHEPTIVVIGGGTGSFTVLSGLKIYTSNITAIVNMADDGSSSGMLRDELGVLPPGDVRRCLVALSRSPKVRELFEYRFDDGALKGHAFGNLFLAALEKMTGNFAEAIETASEVLNIVGRVVPATVDNVRLKFSWPGKQVTLLGEGVIDREHFQYDPRDATLSLEPAAQASPDALAAIAAADLVVIAPGDLYTSLGPILIVDGYREALKDTSAKIAYVCNLVTKNGHTDRFDVAAHASEVERFIGASVIDIVLYNDGRPPAALLERYAREGEFWVEADQAKLEKCHYKTLRMNLLPQRHPLTADASDPIAARRSFIRHDADAVARGLISIL